MSNKAVRLTTSSVFLSVFLLPLSSQDIHAYLDLGTGSLVIQVLIGFFVGGLFLLKVFWGKVKAFVKGIFSKVRRGDD